MNKAVTTVEQLILVASQKIHCKNWGAKMTPVGVNRGPCTPSGVKITP